LHFPELHSNEIEVLIGAAALEAHEITDSRCGTNSQPKAVRTGLGWTLIDPEICQPSGEDCSVNFSRIEQSLHKQMLHMFDH